MVVSTYMFLPIAHLDLDAFFASVEQKLNPSLHGKPVIVGGVDPQGREVNRGVVATASYEARKFGVASGMPIYQARKLCPHGVFLRGNFKEYHAFSKRVFNVIAKYTPFVEQSNLDEGFLHFSGFEELYPDTVRIAGQIRQEIKEVVGLTASVGLGTSKVTAKIACDLAKPDGLLAISEANRESIIFPLPVSKLPGVGPKTEAILKALSITTISDLVNKKESIVHCLGKHGANLYLSATGIDNIWFQEGDRIKSIGRSTTFLRNSNEKRYILPILFKLCDEVFDELWLKELTASCFTVTLRDHTFKTRTLERTYGTPVDRLRDLYEVASSLFFSLWDKKTHVRLVGIRASRLRARSDDDKRYRRIFENIYKLKRKYGEGIVTSALTLDSGNSPMEQLFL